MNRDNGDNDMSETREWLMETQEKLVRDCVDDFNRKIDSNAPNGHIDTMKQGDYFESEVKEVIRRYFSNMSLSIEKDYIRDASGKFHQIDIVVRPTDSPSKDNILAVVEVKSFADMTGYRRFKKVLELCGLVERGFYVGINGTMLGIVHGENQNLKPKVFFFTRSMGASVRKRKRMKYPEVYAGVLQHFLKALEDQIRILVGNQ